MGSSDVESLSKNSTLGVLLRFVMVVAKSVCDYPYQDNVSCAAAAGTPMLFQLERYRWGTSSSAGTRNHVV
jgi:hypothetical protein